MFSFGVLLVLIEKITLRRDSNRMLLSVLWFVVSLPERPEALRRGIIGGKMTGVFFFSGGFNFHQTCTFTTIPVGLSRID